MTTLGEGAYDLLWRAAGPLFARGARRRLGPADPARWAERLGEASLPRPAGPLIWLHAASVGEAVTARALAGALREAGFGGTLLATTFTETGAESLGGEADVVHQYAPLNHPAWGARFLDHWSPDLAVMLVGEVWPGLLREARARRVPLVFASAAPSDRSLGRWGAAEALGLHPLRAFDSVFAVDADRARAMSSLVRVVPEVHGDLKVSAPRPAVNASLVESLRTAAGGRRVLLAASTHPGEDAPLLDLVQARDTYCIVAPRHPSRADSIAQLAADRGLRLTRRTVGPPRAEDRVYLLDTLGEMGSAYAAADVTFVGGSLFGSGHSPAEAALSGCAAVIGPGSSANAAVTRELVAAGALLQGDDVPGTLAALGRLLDDAPLAASMGAAAGPITVAWREPARRSAEALLARLDNR